MLSQYKSQQLTIKSISFASNLKYLQYFLLLPNNELFCSTKKYSDLVTYIFISVLILRNLSLCTNSAVWTAVKVWGLYNGISSLTMEIHSLLL